MHHIAKLRRTDSLLGELRIWFVKRTMAEITVAVVLSGASVLIPFTSAGADQIGSTKAQVSAVQAQIQAKGAQLHALTVAFQQANLDATTLGQQVSADQARIAQLQSRVSVSETVLRKEVVLSYTGGAGGNLGVPMATTDPAVRAEYVQVATGNLKDNLDHFRTQQRELATAAATLIQQQQLSQAAVVAAGNARQQALAAASAEQAQLNRLQGQLNQYVQAAAVSAQQRAAADAAAAASTQGLPVNNGLVSVVAAIVTPPPPAPAPPPPPPQSPGYTDAGGHWLQLRQCESGDNYAANTGNGYYGAYQFTAQTWSGLGFPGRPDLESHQMQDQAAMKLQAQSGWGQWPACSAALGLH